MFFSGFCSINNGLKAKVKVSLVFNNDKHDDGMVRNDCMQCTFTKDWKKPTIVKHLVYGLIYRGHGVKATKSEINGTCFHRGKHTPNMEVVDLFWYIWTMTGAQNWLGKQASRRTDERTEQRTRKSDPSFRTQAKTAFVSVQFLLTQLCDHVFCTHPDTVSLLVCFGDGNGNTANPHAERSVPSSAIVVNSHGGKCSQRGVGNCC